MNAKIAMTLCIAISSFGCAAQSKVVANPSYELASEEMSRLAVEANEGSGDAAVRLSDHFFYQLPKGAIDYARTKALEWALIGSENGNSKAMFRAYQLLSISGERERQLRALFWLKRSASAGDDNARRELSVCASVDALRPSGTPCFGPEAEG